MLTLSELKRRAGREKVPAAIIEKDYVLLVALGAIANSELANHLVFKGGTAIKMVYFKEARFSEDLDFTVLKLGKEAVLSGLNEALGGKTIEGIEFQKPEEEKTVAGLKVALKYRGPLMHTQRIRFDFSFRDNLIQSPLKKPLLNDYASTKHEITVLGIEEIFAEKLHALGNRAAPRDLYDVWYLLGKGLVPNVGIVRKKFEFYGEKFDLRTVESLMPKMRLAWDHDLRQVMPNVPSVELIFNEVMEKLRKAGF